MARAMAIVGAALRFAVGAVVIPGMFVVGVAGGFFGGLRLYERVAPIPPPAVPDERPTFELSREQLDAMLEGEGAEAKPADAKATPEAPPAEAPAKPAEEPPKPEEEATKPAEEAGKTEALDPELALQRTIALVRLHRAVDAAQLDALSCEQLAWARDWLWASRGYVFSSPEAKAWFSGRDGYRPDPTLSLDTIEAAFTEVDQANRNVLTGSLRKESCPCPTSQPRSPCPE